MEVYSIVDQLRGLARDPRNRATIVQDQGCLPGLVLFLDNESGKVVATAVEALLLLSECEANHSTMYRELGLVISLETIFKATGTERSVAEMARRTLENIMPVSSRPALAEVQAAPGASQQSIFRDNINKAARAIVLQVDGLDDLQCRRIVEQQLLDIKGVVSFTFDMKTSRVSIRIRDWVKIETVCKRITDTKIMRARQVIRDECGQEVILSFGSSPAKFSKENAAAEGPAAAAATSTTAARIPDYLDEVDKQPVNTKAVARVGDTGANAAGWWSAIGGYVSKALYW